MNVEKHRKIVRFTYPIWLYVTTTGVIVYAMISFLLQILVLKSKNLKAYLAFIAVAIFGELTFWPFVLESILMVCIIFLHFY